MTWKDNTGSWGLQIGMRERAKGVQMRGVGDCKLQIAICNLKDRDRASALFVVPKFAIFNLQFAICNSPRPRPALLCATNFWLLASGDLLLP